MPSGTIKGTTGNQYIDSKIEWSYTQNTANNQSTISATLYYKRNNSGFTTTGTGTFKITIGGAEKTETKYLTITENAWVQAVQLIAVVDHGDDGKKSVTISATGSIPSTTLSSTSCSETVTLATIPRASTITSVSDTTLGKICSVTWKPYSKNFSYKLKFSMGSWSYTTSVIIVNSTSTFTYAMYKIPLEVANQITGSPPSATMTVTLYTYSNTAATTQLGSADSKTFKVTVPDNESTKPSISVSLVPVNTGLSTKFSSLFIQGKSKVKATVSGEGKYSATIAAKQVYDGGKYYTSPYTSGYLSRDGVYNLVGRVTDSRGYYNESPQEINVVPYSKPKIQAVNGESEVVATRCDASGNITSEGTYLKIKAKRSYSPVESGGQQYNFCEIRYRYMVEGGSYSGWSTILASDSLDSDEVVTGALLDGTLSATSTYVVQVQAIDDIGADSYTTIYVATSKVYMHKAASRNSLGIGKYAEDDNIIDVADDISTRFRGDVQIDGSITYGGEKWESLGLSSSVTESTSSFGRGGNTGCYYRVSGGGKHIYVAFNCAFEYADDPIQVNAQALPTNCRPPRNVYAMCATGGRAIARVLVNKNGIVMVDFVQVITAVMNTTSHSVGWIDGYIDFWV